MDIHGYTMSISQFIEIGAIPYAAEYCAEKLKIFGSPDTILLVDVDGDGIENMTHIAQSKEILSKILQKSISLQVLNGIGEHCLNI